jgi:hypothetical protein
MRRLVPCLCLVLLCAGTSLSQTQDYPKWDFTAAYVFNDLETPAPQSRNHLHGGSGAVAWNFRRWAALEGDVTYTRANQGGNTRSLVSFTAGPRFTKRGSFAQPFVHALFGGGRLSGYGPTADLTTHGWVGKMGGGLDLVANKHVAIRPFQVDYYRYHGNTGGVGNQRLDNFTLSLGIRIF